jgi:excinuclease UvrABC ATPase subunit
MSVEEALEFFDNKKICKMLSAMKDVGLSYMTLGQPLSTLSGGERQRIKLAKYLDKKGNIYIMDEPTTGLHASDVVKLMALFDTFVDKGNTVIIIEHNLDVVKQADYIIDVGVDGGKNGGRVVFEGTPQEMATGSDTITARCLKLSLAGSRISDDELALLMELPDTPNKMDAHISQEQNVRNLPNFK